MRVENHRLLDDHIPIEYLESRRSRVIVPEVVVIHYGVINDHPTLVRAQKRSGFVAHLTIDGWSSGQHGAEYRVTQLMPLNEMGSHAGKSDWRGRPSVNVFSIGIEIANPGPLIRGVDGKLRTVHGQEWDEDEALEERHRLPTDPTWTHWARYTNQEIDLLIAIIGAVRQVYPIRDVVGHDEITDRKRDPGPAFPMDWLREQTLK